MYRDLKHLSCSILNKNIQDSLIFCTFLPKYIMIWKNKIDIDAINATSKQTLSGHLGIEFTAWGDDYISAKMPVDKRTIQPFGLLHGGASVALAETIGSVSLLCFV